ncbi:MAG: VOC family protein [Thermoprotei archaeon]
MVLKRAILAISNLSKAREFYGEILGLKIQESDRGLYISNGTLELIEDKAKHPAGTYVYHIALRVPNRPALGAFLKRILEFEEVIEGFADHLVSEAIYLRDFDRIGIEIYVDKPKDQWPRDNDGNIIMDTQHLDVKNLLQIASARPTTTVELGHIHMRTTKLEEVEEFYKGLGFRTTGHWIGAIFMAYGDYHHHIAFNNWPIPRPKDGTGLLEIRLLLPIKCIDPLGIELIRESIVD